MVLVFHTVGTKTKPSKTQLQYFYWILSIKVAPTKENTHNISCKLNSHDN